MGATQQQECCACDQALLMICMKTRLKSIGEKFGRTKRKPNLLFVDHPHQADHPITISDILILFLRLRCLLLHPRPPTIPSDLTESTPSATQEGEASFETRQSSPDNIPQRENWRFVQHGIREEVQYLPLYSLFTDIRNLEQKKCTIDPIFLANFPCSCTHKLTITSAILPRLKTSPEGKNLNCHLPASWRPRFSSGFLGKSRFLRRKTRFFSKSLWKSQSSLGREVKTPCLGGVNCEKKQKNKHGFNIF